jgi:hypothetical protein
MVLLSKRTGAQVSPIQKKREANRCELCTSFPCGVEESIPRALTQAQEMLC